MRLSACMQRCKTQMMQPCFSLLEFGPVCTAPDTVSRSVQSRFQHNKLQVDKRKGDGSEKMSAQTQLTDTKYLLYNVIRPMYFKHINVFSAIHEKKSRQSASCSSWTKKRACANAACWRGNTFGYHTNAFALRVYNEVVWWFLVGHCTTY